MDTTATSWSPISSQLPFDEDTLVHDSGVERPVGEEPEQQRTDDPADEVHADHVERVVVAEAELHADREEADGAGDEPDVRSGPSRRRTPRTA